MVAALPVNNINVTDGPGSTGNATTNTTTCPGATDGTINVTPATPGTYTYVLSPGPQQTQLEFLLHLLRELIL
ncbi:MAG: hypothetical protein IPI98_06235 [Chitinophagaceae bacterium]|nr:hypothetical protein [Chitinophagaceae bacterium]